MPLLSLPRPLLRAPLPRAAPRVLPRAACPAREHITGRALTPPRRVSSETFLPPSSQASRTLDAIASLSSATPRSLALSRLPGPLIHALPQARLTPAPAFRAWLPPGPHSLRHPGAPYSYPQDGYVFAQKPTPGRHCGPIWGWQGTQGPLPKQPWCFRAARGLACQKDGGQWEARGANGARDQ